MDHLDKNQIKEPDTAARPTSDQYRELPVKDFSYINNSSPVTKTAKRWPIVLIVCLVVVALGLGAAYFGLHHPKAKAVTKSSTSQPVTNGKSAFNSTSASAPTSNYTSNAFGLSVKYPTNWVISDNGSSSLNITSPVTRLTSDTNKTVNGKVVVSVLPEGQIPPAFGTSDAAAVLNSQLISYANPTADQRAQTYVSFIQYASTTVLGGLDGIYVTGNDGYVKDQDIPASDLSGLDPLVTVTFEACQTTSCTNLNKLTVSSTALSGSNLETEIINIIKSFSFD